MDRVRGGPYSDDPDARGRDDRGMKRSRWLGPAALILLSVVPVMAGAFRMTQLTTGAQTPENARFFDHWVPVVAHIVSVSVYCVVGALQFTPALRTRGRRWHRTAGRILVPFGLVAALSGLWLTLFFPRSDIVGDLATAFRLVLGSAMAGAILLGYAAVRRRDFTRHRAWMIRGYAIGIGAGTQVFTFAVWTLAVGPVDKTSNALMMLAGWLINVVVAEWIIRRRPARPTPSMVHTSTLIGAVR